MTIEEETFTTSEQDTNVVECECVICGIEKEESQAGRFYCENCYDHLAQSYQWMQSSMVSAAELKKLQKQIYDLTDVQQIKFD